MIEKMYTAKEASEALGCDDRKVYYWIAMGQLVAVNVSTDVTGERPIWRIAESDLMQFIEARKSRSAVVRSASAKVQSNKRPVLQDYI